MRVVVALGGNAIAEQDGSIEPEAMRVRIGAAVDAIADIARSCETVVTHGNGPQVGLLAMQAQAGPPDVDPQPLDVIGAESEGMIGYMLERELASLFPNSDVATLLTQVEVDADDPAFATPEKPIGPVLTEDRAHAFADRLGWRFRSEGDGLRRVVPSPRPQRVRARTGTETGTWRQHAQQSGDTRRALLSERFLEGQTLRRRCQTAVSVL